MHVSSIDLSTPSKTSVMLPSMSWMHPPNKAGGLPMYAHKPSILWEASLSKFVHNRMVELLKSG
jgi:hypothetical protein